jgi:hypothetical protein
MVGNAGKTSNWIRDPRTPGWLRVAWRNTRSLNRFLFKRKGLKRTRAVLYLLTRPIRRTTMFVKFRNLLHDQLDRIEMGEEGSGTQFLEVDYSLLTYVRAQASGYWNSFRLGIPIYDRAEFARTTGFTSQGEANMMDPPDMLRSQDSFYTMPVSQAKAVLNIDVTNFYPRIVDQNFSRIFMANQISNGGSWYLLCRIYCAKRVLDREMRDLGVRDPPHLRPDDSPEANIPPPVYKDQMYEERMAYQKQKEANMDGRRSNVNKRKSKIDPNHGSKYGFSTVTKNFGTWNDRRNYSTSIKNKHYRFDQGSTSQSFDIYNYYGYDVDPDDDQDTPTKKQKPFKMFTQNQ